LTGPTSPPPFALGGEFATRRRLLMRCQPLGSVSNRSLFDEVKMFSYAEAQRLVDWAIQQASARQQAIVVAVTDSHGELLAFARMDGSGLPSIGLAQAKAYTAARERNATLNMGQWARANGRTAADWSDPKLTLFGGGVPIWRDGKVVAAIAISGLPEEDDHQLASDAAVLANA